MLQSLAFSDLSSHLKDVKVRIFIETNNILNRFNMSHVGLFETLLEPKQYYMHDLDISRYHPPLVHFFFTPLLLFRPEHQVGTWRSPSSRTGLLDGSGSKTAKQMRKSPISWLPLFVRKNTYRHCYCKRQQKRHPRLSIYEDLMCSITYLITEGCRLLTKFLLWYHAWYTRIRHIKTCVVL